MQRKEDTGYLRMITYMSCLVRRADLILFLKKTCSIDRVIFTAFHSWSGRPQASNVWYKAKLCIYTAAMWSGWFQWDQACLTCWKGNCLPRAPSCLFPFLWAGTQKIELHHISQKLRTVVSIGQIELRPGSHRDSCEEDRPTNLDVPDTQVKGK